MAINMNKKCNVRILALWLTIAYSGTITLLSNYDVPIFNLTAGVRMKLSDMMRLPEARMEHKIKNVRWSDDGKRLYFRWQPSGMKKDTLYYITREEITPRIVSQEEAATLVEGWGIPGYPEGWTHPRSYNDDRSLRVYITKGDIFLLNILTGEITQLTHTP
jgi:hypothetical protein